MDNNNDEVRIDLVTINSENGSSQSLTLTGYNDDTVMGISEDSENPKLFSFSREQLEELYQTLGKALDIREENLSEVVLHFTNSEVQESMNNR